jgi:DNA polymerase V
MKTRFALVDCNNFYASCERVFDPRLIGRPLAILSNNDGCVIARSEEVKRLGVPMGAPAHEHKATFEKNAVVVMSSNYALYGDMSARVMETLRPCVPVMEVYSIDEAFLALEDWQGVEFARELRARVRQWTGIPVSIGIGPTKTLAKMANRLAKKTPELGGVLDLETVRDMDELLSRVPCEDIWGIGKRLAVRLAAGGIRTACDLKYGEAAWVRKTLGVVGERIRLELQGVSCLALEEVPAPKKGIASAKSFGRPVESLRELEEALATYTARAAEKLRAGRLLARQVHVFVATNPFSARQPQYSAGAQTALVRPSNHTPDLIAAAIELLREIYRPGHQYKKTGIFVTDLIAESDLQPDLFDAALEAAGRVRELDQIVDGLNRKLGRNAIRYGSMGVKSRWAMRQERRSRKFTTRWDELPVAKA